MKSDFQLPKSDVEFLNTLGLPWETIQEGSIQWLVIHQWPIPSGYTVDSSKIALRIPPNYPVADIDMAYFYPHLILKSKRSIPQTSGRQNINTESFQRWSRHRTGANPWREGVDDISTHLTQARYWVEKEAKENVQS